MNRPTAAELLATPEALLTRTHLRELGLERRERRSVSRSPGRGVAGLLEAARPRADYLALLDESTHDGVTRVR